MKNYESAFQKWLINNPNQRVGNKKFELLNTEILLHNPYKKLSEDLYTIRKEKNWRTPIGKIDIYFKYRQTKYLGEIKWTKHRSDFWQALKILGYVNYYEWQEDRRVKPAILIPREHIRLEQEMVAGQLKIALFGLHRFPDNPRKTRYKIEPINL